MMYKFNDWQDLSIKKDIERISRNHGKTDSVGLALTFDAALAILIICAETVLDWDLKNKNVCVFWWLVTIGFLPFFILFIKYLLQLIARKTASIHVDSPEKLIDLFDNELCVYVMMAQSYLDIARNARKTYVKKTVAQSNAATTKVNCTASSNITRKPSPNEMTFLYIETCFYINKVITGLVRMSYKADKVFSGNYDDLCTSKRVSIERLENMLLLINELIDAATVIPGVNINSVKITRKVNDKQREQLVQFCTDINAKFLRTIPLDFKNY